MTLKSNHEVYQLMTELGQRNLHERLAKARKGGYYSDTAPGSFLVGSVAGTAVEWVNKTVMRPSKGRPHTPDRLKMIEVLGKFGVERAVGIATKVIFDRIISQENSYVHSVVKHISSAISDEITTTDLIKALGKDAPRIKPTLKALGSGRYPRKRMLGFVGRLMESLAEEERQHVEVLTPATAALLGHTLLAAVMKTSGILKTQRSKLTSKKTALNITLDQTTKDWLDRAEAIATQIQPTNLPVLTTPLDWENVYDGGYPMEWNGRRPLITTNDTIHVRSMEAADCPDVYRAVNTMQRTPWAVNERVLNVMRVVAFERWSAPSLKLPDWAAAEVPPRPEGLDPEDRDHPLHRQWTKLVRHAHRHKDANIRLAARTARLLHVAEQFRGTTFYYIHALDFRGRAYPLGGPFQYQGDDKQRGVLRFEFGKPLVTDEAHSWFSIHGANCWGADKLPFEDRIEWVVRHEDEIRRTAADPLSYRWWTEADKPWQFLAWCFEAAEWFDAPDGYYSYLPVGMDGSNNGLQLYSLLLRDPVGGAATNCTPSTAPQDIYKNVAKAVTKHLNTLRFDRAADPQQRKWADQFSVYWPDGLPRSAVKRPVMTLPYGAVLHTCQRYIASWYFDEVKGRCLIPPPFPDQDAYEFLSWLAKLVWAEIGKTVVSAIEGMGWLRRVSDIVSKLEKSPSWITPTGFIIRQRYRKPKSVRIDTYLGRRVAITYNDDRHSKLSVVKQRNGIAPNYIHSLDAALMVRTVNAAKIEGVECFMMIHDSFATHAADAEIMARCLRAEAVKMFQGNLLEDLREQIQEQVGDIEIPPPPIQGSLDLNDILVSKYFFA